MDLPQVTLLNNSTQETASDYLTLSPGEWNISLETGNAAASVGIEKQRDGSSVDRPVIKGGSAVALTTLEPDVIETSKGDKYRVTNADGSEVATVIATRVPTIVVKPYQ